MREEYAAFNSSATSLGIIRGAEELADASRATTVRIRSGRRILRDGPVGDTGEVLGGFYLLECASLVDAIDWATKIPDARRGSIEVRPVVERN